MRVASRVACAIVNGLLHICVLEAPGALWHTVETGPHTFTGWGPAHSVAFSGVSPGLSVDCAAIGGQLHVCLDGNVHSGQIVSDPAVWRSGRLTSGSWSLRREVTARFLAIRDVACASITPTGAGARPQLEVLTRPETRAGTAEPLVHTTLFPTGASSGDTNMAASIPPSAATVNFPAVLRVAAAGIGSELHIVLAQGTELFHTVNLGSAGGAFDLYGNVRALVSGAKRPFRGALALPACANVGGNLHVCAVSNGRIFHTIRLASGLWRNPESSAFGMFGDVTKTVAGGPATPDFVDIACAGDPF